MGETPTKPGHYWDHREARWVRYAAEPVVPAPATPLDDRVGEVVEADAPAG